MGGETKMAERKIFQMDLDPSLIKIKKVLNTQDFIELEIWGISNHYPTNNNNYFPVETMKQNIEENNFYGKPVLGRFNNITDNYEVHNSKQKWDPEFNQEYTDYEDKGERPLGFCHDPNVRLEKDKNGDTWCVFNVVLWVKYGYRGIKKILKTGVGKVSAEVSVYQSHYDENGIEIFDKWTFDGITILGYKKGTTVEAHEGIEDAHRCITDKMKEKIYSDKLLKIQRTFEADMEEFNSDIYKNKEKGERLLDNQAKTGAKEEFVIEEILEEVEETPLGVEEVENEAIPEEECNNSEVEEAAEEPVAECNNADEGEDEEVEKEPEEECNNEEKEPEDAEEPEEECKNADEGEDEEVAKEEPEEEPEEEPAEECNNSDEGEDEEVEKEPEEPAEECGNFEEAPEEGCDDCEPEEECNKFEAEESVVEEKEFELSDGTKVDADRLYQVYLEALLEQDSLKKEFNEVKAELEEYKKQEAFNKVEALKAEVYNFAKDKNIDSSLVAKIVKQCEEGEITDFLTAKKDMVFALYENTEATEASNHSFVAKVEEISINQKSKKMNNVDPIQGLADFLKN